MNLNVRKEWKILNDEIFENRPKEAPYQEKIVKKRELLLLAQNLLSDYAFAKTKAEKCVYGCVYKDIMNEYFG